MNTRLRQKVKTNFEKSFLKSINNAVCGREIYRDTKLVANEKRRNY